MFSQDKAYYFESLHHMHILPQPISLLPPCYLVKVLPLIRFNSHFHILKLAEIQK